MHSSNPQPGTKDLSAPPAIKALPPTHEQRAGLGVGLFVGINSFVDPALNPLRFAVNDAIDLAHAFVCSLQMLSPGHVCLAIDAEPTDEARAAKLRELVAIGVHRYEPTRSQLLDTLSWLTDLSAARLVIAMSTHGFADSVMPKDGRARPDLLDDTALTKSRLEKALARSTAPLQLLYLDACRNMPLKSGPGQKSAMLSGLTEVLDAHSGRAVIRSCDFRQVSYEFEELGNGLAAHYLLRALGVRERVREDPVYDAPTTSKAGYVTLGSAMVFMASATQRFLADISASQKHPQLRAGGVRQTPCLDASEELRQMPLAVGAAQERPQVLRKPEPASRAASGNRVPEMPAPVPTAGDARPSTRSNPKLLPTTADADTREQHKMEMAQPPIKPRLRKEAECLLREQGFDVKQDSSAWWIATKQLNDGTIEKYGIYVRSVPTQPGVFGSETDFHLGKYKGESRELAESGSSALTSPNGLIEAWLVSWFRQDLATGLTRIEVTFGLRRKLDGPRKYRTIIQKRALDQMLSDDYIAKKVISLGSAM